MSEDWGDLESLPPPKKGVPKWVWFCGCGCLIPAILLGVLFFWATGVYKKGLDEELQWEQLDEVLPHDGQSEDYELAFGVQFDFFDFEMYVFHPTLVEGVDGKRLPDGVKNLSAFIAVWHGGYGEGIDEIFDATQEGIEPYVAPGTETEVEITEVETAETETAETETTETETTDFPDVIGVGPEGTTVVVQGRELRIVSISEGNNIELTIPGVPEPKGDDGAGVAVELSAEGDANLVVLFLIHAGSDEPPTPADIVKFLAPFRIGEDR